LFHLNNNNVYFEPQSYIILSEKQQKAEKIVFFYKKVPKNFVSFRKSRTFAPAKQNKRVLKNKFWGMV
jgi:hypothetical protein